MKIEALPSLSLQEFQDRKKQQRLKKNKIIQKINDGSRKKLGQSSTSFDRNATEAARKLQEEAERALLVGSQKRKARKQSITHNAAAGSSKEDQDSSKREYFFFLLITCSKKEKKNEKFFLFYRVVLTTTGPSCTRLSGNSGGESNETHQISV